MEEATKFPSFQMRKKTERKWGRGILKASIFLLKSAASISIKLATSSCSKCKCWRDHDEWGESCLLQKYLTFKWNYLMLNRIQCKKAQKQFLLRLKITEQIMGIPLDKILQHISLIFLLARVYDLASAGKKTNECKCRVFTRPLIIFKELFKYGLFVKKRQKDFCHLFGLGFACNRDI